MINEIQSFQSSTNVLNLDTSNKNSEKTPTLTDTNLLQQDAKKDGKQLFSTIIEIETP